MIDRLGRNVRYMRISVTEQCNLRCRYCMPKETEKKDASHLLTEEELICAVETAASLGVDKIRITGGEPLVKSNILSLCRRVAQTEGIKEVCLTTNGLLLPQLAKPLREAGIARINLSLDTLDEEKYRYITRKGELSQFLRGLEAALAAGFRQVKINSVLIGGFNDDEIEALAELTCRYPVDVRFIELMPMLEGEFSQKAFLSGQEVLQRLPQLQAVESPDGVAKCYRLPGGKGSVGLISPISAHFCGSCNRIRLTADGKIKPCLHSGEEYSIKGVTREKMLEIMQKAIWNKPVWHGELDADHPSRAGRSMNRIGG